LPTQTTNYVVNANGATPFFLDPAGTYPDFHLTSSATTNIVDKGTASGAPTTDIGFDPKCIKKGTPGGASWWSYVIDYTYIANLGGVAKCFAPATRSGVPDIGAYEYNGTTGTGGTSATGGTSSGGTATGGKATGGAVSTGGVLSTGGASGGTVGNGGTGGSLASGGTGTAGGPSDPNPETCSCRVASPPNDEPGDHAKLLGLLGLAVLGLRRRRARR
jgi:MYXO-CTERM domain-containing protein